MRAIYRKANIAVNRFSFLTENKHSDTVRRMKYGERLKIARLHAKMTQAQLAEACGVQQPTISELENADATGSSYTVRFARRCGVSVDWLSDEIGDMIPVYFQTTDPKIIAVAKVMEPLPEYAKDAAVKDVAQVAQLVARAKANGTDG